MFERTDIDLNVLTRKTYFCPPSDFILPDHEVTIKNNMVIIDNIVSDDFCDSVVSFMKTRATWVKAKVVGENDSSEDANKSKRQNNQSSTAPFESLDKSIYEIFSKGLNIVRKEFSGLVVGSDEGYSVLRYKVGEFYDYHIDHGGPYQRIISSLLYLNDDYVGGETQFKNTDYKIEPKKGRLAFFPSSYTHEHKSCAVTKGTKYNIVTWYN